MQKIKFIIYFVCLSLLTLSAQTDKLIPEGLSENAMFGYDVAVSTPWAVVSATGQSSGNSFNAGEVYVYKLNDNNWELNSILNPGSSNNFGLFGSSVAIDGPVIAVGAPGDKEKGAFYGAVYVFELNNGSWTQSSKLMPSDGIVMEHFGTSVDVAGGVIAAGAPSGNGNVLKSGAVYAFEKNSSGWKESAKLYAMDSEENDYFGYDLSVQTDGTIAVGAPRAFGAGDGTGVVYVFRKSGDTYGQAVKLFDEFGTTGDRFGNSVSIDSDRIAVGSHVNSYNKIFPGAVFVYSFVAEGWKLNSKIFMEREHNDYFGYDVALCSDYLIIGVPNKGSEAGDKIGLSMLYMYDGTEWKEDHDYQMHGEIKNDYFGSAVAIDSIYLFAGSRLSGTNDAGAAFVSKYQITTGVEDLLPDKFSLSNNYPNPFNPSTNIKYTLPVRSSVKIVVFNLLGQEVEKLVNDLQTPGYKEITWKAFNYSSGVYFIRLDAEPVDGNFDSFSSIKKMVLVK